MAESMEPVDPASIIGDVAELYEPVAEEAGLASRDRRAEQGLSIVANRELVGQAVANLVDNAIKYSADAGGAPADGARRTGHPSPLARVGDGVEIAVADRGPGVAAAGPRARAAALRAPGEEPLAARQRPGPEPGRRRRAAARRLASAWRTTRRASGPSSRCPLGTHARCAATELPLAARASRVALRSRGDDRAACMTFVLGRSSDGCRR